MSSSGTPDAPGGAADEGADLVEEQGGELGDEERAQLSQAAEQVAAIRAQLAAAPVELVVTNHVMGLYELATVHLDQASPDLGSARLAIDALGAILDACKGRLGDAEATLIGARGQIQLAFVAVSRRTAPATNGGKDGAEPSQPPTARPPADQAPTDQDGETSTEV